MSPTESRPGTNLATIAPFNHRETPRGGIVSIIVITSGQLELTRLCLPSLLRHSRPPIELFVLDIDSIDGTEYYLDGLAAASSVPVHAVRVDESDDLAREFRSVVDGLLGQFVAVVCNDVIVPPRWLDQLVALADSDPKHGMVGPMSNYAPTQQYAGRASYRIKTESRPESSPRFRPGEPPAELSAFCQHAHDWREKHKGQWFKTEFLGGFCLLLRRELIAHIVPDFRRHGLAYFDEIELSKDVLKQGFSLACCKDLIVHNFGTRKAYQATSRTSSTNNTPVPAMKEEPQQGEGSAESPSS